eukprot:TRINITY_DN3534_c0_g2_i1.p1 TRINITY_DN3534_c0_g2~~TRINITY_DN3534_c0_g2_i1.p1  ORF type:complete len:413 (-),score=39.35 TRINITY_DN3534_c0_g2_i1:300-1460(-)
MDDIPLKELSSSDGRDDFSDQAGLLSSKAMPVDLTATAEGAGNSGLAHTVFNFVNTIVGSGIIGLPFAMNEAGLGLGLCELVLFAILTDYSICILVRAGVESGHPEYQALCRHAFGTAGYVLGSIFMFGMAFGAMLSYSVIIGDTIPSTFAAFLGSDSFLAQRSWMIIIPTLVIMLPLSSLRRISLLSHTSLVSLLAVLLIMGVYRRICYNRLIVLITIRGVQVQFDTLSPMHVVAGPTAWAFAHPNFLQATGVISFAYVCHHNTFLLRAQLRDNTRQRWQLTTHISVFLSMAACIFLAVVGYTTFYTHTVGNLLNNFTDLHDAIILTARLSFALTMFFTFPLEAHVARYAVEEVWGAIQQARGKAKLTFWYPSLNWKSIVIVTLR